MLRATLKSLLSRKARLLLSSIAVILGVTFVSASLVLNASLGASVQSMFTTIYDDIDIEINSAKTTQTYLGEAPGTVPQDVVDEVADNADVDSAEGTVRNDTGLVRVLDKNDKVLPQITAPIIGQNWEEPQDPVELREGDGPQSDDEIVVSQSLLNATGYELGDTVPIITDSSEADDYEIAGVVGYSGGRDSVSGEILVMFTMDTAREKLIDGEPGYTHITVTSKSGVDNDELRDDLAASIGDDYKVNTGEDLAEDQAESFQSILDLFNYLLLGFGGVALLVSVFLIINTFSIIVAQRTRELALFRAVGASRSQIRGSVLLEATLIGLLSAVVGLGLGIGIGHLGNIIVTGTMGEAMTATLIVPVSAIIAAFAIGIGVTIVAAILPALRASRIPPIAALRDSSNTVRPVRWFAVFGSLFLAAGGVLLWAGLTEKFGDGDPSLLGTVGAVGLLFIGALVIIPAVARPLVSAIGSLLSWTLAGKLGRRNSSRNPRRTAITASALMIGVAIVTGVGVLSASTEASIQKFFDNSVQADIVVAAGQQGAVIPTYDKSLLTDMNEMDDVEKIAGMYLSSANIEGQDTMITATDDFASMADLLGDNIVEGSQTLGDDEVAVYENQADKDKLELGDTVSVTLPKGEEREMTIGAILQSESGSTGYVFNDHYSDEFSESEPAQAYIQVTEGADKEAVIEDIQELLKDNPQVSAFDMSQQTEQIGQIFDVILLSVQILLALAMLIAVIGVVNTLTLSVLERTRELGLVRAVGMTRWQVTSMVAVEAVVISVFGAVLGIGIGSGLGIAVQQALKDDFVDVLAMPWGTMVTYLIAAIVIGLFSAIIPAYRANKLDVLEAVSSE